MKAKQNQNPIESARESWQSCRRIEAELSREHAQLVSDHDKQSFRSPDADVNFRLAKFDLDRRMIEASIATRQAARAHDAAATEAALATGDPDTAACDYGRVSRDVHALLDEGARARAECSALASTAFEPGQDIRETLARSAALRSFAIEAESLADARLEHAAMASARLRARRQAAGEPPPRPFPQRPGFTSGPAPWLAVVDGMLAAPPVDAQDDALAHKLALLDRAETEFRAGLQAAEEERAARRLEAEHAKEVQADNDRRAQKARDAEQRATAAAAEIRAAEMLRLAHEHKHGKGTAA